MPQPGTKITIAPVAPLADKPSGPVIENEEQDDGCGIGYRGIADWIRITVTSTKRIWNIPYHSFVPDQGEQVGDMTRRLSFLRGQDLCWLKITAGDVEPTFVDYVILMMQQRSRKSLRADRRRIVDISIELAPPGYDPFDTGR